jgi:hypothetical protein
MITIDKQKILKCNKKTHKWGDVIKYQTYRG